MNDSRTCQLEMRWIPVTDERGRTRMEAVWIDPTTVSAAHAA
ncbi:hypothetical protein [Nocardioides sp. 1609]|nr:hypothetical protein [Nocardioides sp. 1609]